MQQRLVSVVKDVRDGDRVLKAVLVCRRRACGPPHDPSAQLRESQGAGEGPLADERPVRLDLGGDGPAYAGEAARVPALNRADLADDEPSSSVLGFPLLWWGELQ